MNSLVQQDLISINFIEGCVKDIDTLPSVLAITNRAVTGYKNLWLLKIIIGLFVLGHCLNIRRCKLDSKPKSSYKNIPIAEL